MILRKIRLEGWKCFADPVEIGPFGERLTVVHAPNGSGKSTVLEALTRALFDGHRVTGAGMEVLRPWGRDLTPKVSVEFRHRDTEYRLSKVFLDEPSALLEKRDGERFTRCAQGEKADVEVREILSRNPPGRGVSRLDNMGLAQVLFAPQGELGLRKVSGDLVADIRAALDAQATGCGGPLEKKIEEAYLRFFTPTGKTRAGKDAPDAVKLAGEVEQLEIRKTEAARLHQQFEDTARAVEDAQARRQAARLRAEELRRGMDVARRRAAQFGELTARLEASRLEAEAAQARHSQLDSRLRELEKARREHREARETVLRLETELPALRAMLEKARREDMEARSRLHEIRRKLAKLDEEQALLDQASTFVARKADLEALDRKLAELEAAEAAATTARNERLALVAPDSALMKKIRKAARERNEAAIQLDAALITLEIEPRADGEIEVVSGEASSPHTTQEAGGSRGNPPERLHSGRPFVIKGSPEVVVEVPGFGRIRAGGPAGSAEELRARRDKLDHKLRDLCAGFGTTDLEMIELLAEQASALEGRITQSQSLCDALLGQEEPDEPRRARVRAAATVTEVLEAHPDWGHEAPDVDALREQLRRSRTEIQSLHREVDLETQRASAAVQEAAEAVTRAEANLRNASSALERGQSRISEFEQDGGDDTSRANERDRLVLLWQSAGLRQKEIAQELAGYPDDPAEELKTLEAQQAAAEHEAEEAFGQQRSLEGALSNVAARSPYTALCEAEEALVHARRRQVEELARMQGVKLLRDTVEACRREVLSAIAAPVESAATRMFHRIAGSKLGGVVLDGSFVPCRVTPQESIPRNGGHETEPEGFLAGEGVLLEAVSGGEAEQIHLSVRLALAQVLSREERQLVVLDDVLTATDTGRLARALRILEEAAECLQIVILTCHPERYRGMTGAQFLELGR